MSTSREGLVCVSGDRPVTGPTSGLIWGEKASVEEPAQMFLCSLVPSGPDVADDGSCKTAVVCSVSLIVTWRREITALAFYSCYFSQSSCQPLSTCILAIHYFFVCCLT